VLRRRDHPSKNGAATLLHPNHFAQVRAPPDIMSKSMTVFGHRFFSLLTLCLLSIIGIADDARAAESSDPIVVGVLHSERYPFAQMMKNSYDMALEAINRKGGIKGRQLKLVFADDQGEKEAGERAVKRLAKDSGAVMLVGGYESRNTIYTARVADRLDLPFMVITAADDRITQRQWKNVFRMNPPASEYAKGVEQMLRDKIKPASMAIVYENSPYGTGAALRMMWFCREYDISLNKLIPYHRERAERLGPEYLQNLLKPVQVDAPDVIYMVSYLNDAVLLVKTLRDLRIDSLLIGGAGGFTHHKFTDMAGESAEGVLTATLWTPQMPYPGAMDYYSLYLQKYSAPPDYHGAEAYSALFVVADVLQRADTLGSDSIHAAFSQTKIETAFGPVMFQSYGKFERQNSLPTMVLKVEDGAFEVVWPQDVGTSTSTVPVE
jgi:branched-chain amino acid transport system substrate-binding protein